MFDGRLIEGPDAQFAKNPERPRPRISKAMGTLWRL